MKQNNPKRKEDKVPQKQNLLLSFLLCIITLGIYSPVWYIKRTPEIENLNTTKKLNRFLGIAYLISLIFTLALALITFVLTNSTISEVQTDFLSQTVQQNTNVAFSFLLITFGIFALITTILAITLSFKTYSIINEALAKKGTNVKLSKFLTLVFNFLYLQYEINRITDDKEQNKRTLPWIVFGIILFLFVSFLAVFYYILTHTI